MDQGGYDANTHRILTSLWQLDRLRPATSGASTGADEFDGGGEVGVVSVGLILGPAPLAEGALVNEGEGADFVSHNDIRCQIEQKVKLRKYSYLGRKTDGALSARAS